MSDVSRILCQIRDGDPAASEELLPLVYQELRRLAAAKLAGEQPGQTLEATALVHEAYLRLVDQATLQNWDSRGHFFAAAAEAMRRILVENARRKASEKRGGGQHRISLDEAASIDDGRSDELLALDEALESLAKHDASAAELVKLRYFAGLTMEQAADAIGISERSAYYLWTYARSWLYRAIRGDDREN